MLRTALTLLALQAALLLGCPPQALAQRPEGAPPTVCFVVGEPEFRSEYTMLETARLLEGHYGLRSEVLLDRSLDGGMGNSIDGLPEALERADVVLFFMRNRQLPDEQLRAIEEYLRSGRPVIGLRTSTHAFGFAESDPRARPWNQFGAQVLGAPWRFDYGTDTSTEVQVADGADQHPILRGVKAGFEVRSSLYHVRPDYPPLGSTVLLRGTPVFEDGERGDASTRNPVAWTTGHPGGGRVFTTTLGHPEDFEQEDFRRLLFNAIHWSLDLPPPEGPVPAMRKVRPKSGSPWIDMDYGPFVSATVLVGGEDNVAHKGIAIPLNVSEDGKPSAGMLFDTDLMRFAAGWTGDFLELRGAVYDGTHGELPRVAGRLRFTTPEGPGWARKGSFEDPRKWPFGPLPKTWSRWKGLFHSDLGVVLSYSVGRAQVLELPGFEHERGVSALTRTIDYRSERDEVVLELAWEPGLEPEIRSHRNWARAASDAEVAGSLAVFQPAPGDDESRRLAVGVVGSTKDVRWRIDEGGHLRLVLPRTGDNRRVKVLYWSPEADQGVRDFWSFVNTSEDPADLVALTEGHRSLWYEELHRRGVLDLREEPDWTETPAPRKAGDLAIVREFPVPDTARAALYAGPQRPVRGDTMPAREGVLLLGPRYDTAAFWEGMIGAWDFDENSGQRGGTILPQVPAFELDGTQWRRGVKGASLEFNGTASAVAPGFRGVDFEGSDMSVALWTRTARDGTLISWAPAESGWQPGCKSLFVRRGKVVFDIGWVGAVTAGRRIDDAGWHHVALTWSHRDGEARIYIDGRLEGRGTLSPGEEPADAQLRLGFTTEDHPEDPWFTGQIDGLRVFRRALGPEELMRLAASTGEPIVTAIALRGVPGAQWVVSEKNARLELPATSTDQDAVFLQWHGPFSAVSGFLRRAVLVGPEGSEPFLVDRVSWPEENPWHAWMRFGAFDFVDGGEGAILTTWSGDVWRVDGLDRDLSDLRWRRIATGLSQPLGIAVVDGQPYVAGRDQITRLHDLDGDGEVDLYQNFNNDTLTTEHFHEPVVDLQVDERGDFYYMKAARLGKPAVHDQHGALLRVSADGRRSEVVATGFRSPNGLAVESPRNFLCSDQEGNWVPANRLNWVVPGGFYGNNWSGPPGPARTTFDLPLCWIHPEVDRSPSQPVRVEARSWGELDGRLLTLSYGTGKVFLTLMEDVGGWLQGGVTPLPIELPTGLMRGRFHPAEDGLYLCGMYGGQSDKIDDGGFYRIRRSEAPLCVPVAVHAVRDGVVLKFTEPLDPATAEDPANFSVTAWNYRWSDRYGSPEYKLDDSPGRTELAVQGAALSADGKTVWLNVSGMQPVMQMHTAWRMRSAEGQDLDSYVHHTVHRLSEISGRRWMSP